MEKIILASGSAYRKEVLTRLHIPFDVIPSDIDERCADTVPIENRPEFLARQKVKAVSERLWGKVDSQAEKGGHTENASSAEPTVKDAQALHTNRAFDSAKSPPAMPPLSRTAAPATDSLSEATTASMHDDNEYTVSPSTAACASASVQCPASASARTFQSAPPAMPRLTCDSSPSPLPLVLGFDTLISFKNTVYGKPKNRAEAARFLRDFSGNTQTVLTAIALYNAATGVMTSRVCKTAVTFGALCESEIQSYLDTNEWQNAAGGYRIQGIGACFVRRIDGSYSSVAGLPIFDLYEILKAQNYRFM